MNKILVDSHIFLWLLYKPQNITKSTEQIIQTAEYVGVSIITLWELATKHKLGKLRFSTEDLLEGVKAIEFPLLLCQPNHIIALKHINLPHKDPFDTLLIAQAKAEGYTLLTADKQLLDSSYKTIDARK